MNAEARLHALARPAVFTEPGALMYAGNCADLYEASLAGKVTLNAWTRRKYPGKPLGEALPQVLSVGGWDAVRTQDWGLKEHCNEGVKIAYLARGSMVLKVDGQRHELTEGQMFVVRPGNCTSSAIRMCRPARSSGCCSMSASAGRMKTGSGPTGWPGRNEIPSD